MTTNITSEFTTLVNSSSNFSQHYHPFDESSALKWTRLFAYGVVFLLGVVGNLLVIRAIGDLQMRNVTNLFITNLAISDLIVSLVNIPFVVTHAHLGYWPFGSVLCKIIPFIQGVSLSASIMTLVAIAMDRYLLIVRYKKTKLSTKQSLKIVATIWLLSQVPPSPLILFSKTYRAQVGQNQYKTKCFEFWPSVSIRLSYTLLVFLSLYFIPLSVISWLYLRVVKKLKTTLPESRRVSRQAQKRIIGMLMTVVVLFAVLWLPYHICFLYWDFAQPEPSSSFTSLVLFTQWLIYAASACNPIIYAVFNTNYRKEFKKMLRCGNEPVVNTRRSSYELH